MSDMARQVDTGRSRSGLRSWIESRTGLATAIGFMRRQSRKPVPAHLSWLYTMGTLAAFFFSIQFVSGFLMLMYYVPSEDMAFQSVQRIQHEAPLGWLIRQLHVWGANFIVIVLLLHVIKVLWYGSYKRPREFTWFVGFLLLMVTLGFCLSGYLLTWNQLAYWGTRVAVATIDSIPYIGPTLKGWVCGSPDVSGSTIGRFFSLHVIVLPATLVVLLGIHLALVTKHGIAPKTTTTEEKELGYYKALEKHGAEPFFPRQIYRELFVLNLGFALLVSVAYLWPLELGEPQSSQTPEHIKPEWYFLPVYQFLKYFDEGLYKALPFLQSWEDSYQISPAFLGFCVINGILGLLFLLPLLDRGRERSMRRRPLFALFAFVLALSIGVLGVLGYVSGRTMTFGGKTYHFTTKGYPQLVTTSAGDGDSVSTGDGASGGEVRGGLGDQAAAAAASEGAERETGAGEPAVAADDGGETEGDVDGETGAAVEGNEERGGGEGGEQPAVADEGSFRTDGLRPGGTCADPNCHDSAPQDAWVTSVHRQNQVECRNCHGGIDTKLPAISREFRDDLEDVLAPQAFAHLGIQLTRRGAVTAPPGRDVPALCGKCHVEVLQVFSELHYDAPPEGQNRMMCVKCHSNHAVQRADETLYEKGYTDADDPRTQPFQETRRLFAAFERRLEGIETAGPLVKLRERGVPVSKYSEALKSAADDFEKKRYLVHALDAQRVKAELQGLEEYLGSIESRLQEDVAEESGRWRFVAFTWAGAILLNALILMRLLQLPGKKRRREEAAVPRTPTVLVPPDPVPPPPVPAASSRTSLADSLRIATLPDELFEVDDEDEEDVVETAEVDRGGEFRGEREAATPSPVPVVPVVDRLRISTLPDELFEVDEEEEGITDPSGPLDPPDDAERRALLE